MAKENLELNLNSNIEIHKYAIDNLMEMAQKLFKF